MEIPAENSSGKFRLEIPVWNSGCNLQLEIWKLWLEIRAVNYSQILQLVIFLAISSYKFSAGNSTCKRCFLHGNYIAIAVLFLVFDTSHRDFSTRILKKDFYHENEIDDNEEPSLANHVPISSLSLHRVLEDGMFTF